MSKMRSDEVKIKDRCDYDLDVYSALNGFPQNAFECYIYIRGDTTCDDSVCVSYNICGEPEAIVDTLLAIMDDDEEIKDIIIGTAAEYIKGNGSSYPVQE